MQLDTRGPAWLTRWSHCGLAQPQEEPRPLRGMNEPRDRQETGEYRAPSQVRSRSLRERGLQPVQACWPAPLLPQAALGALPPTRLCPFSGTCTSLALEEPSESVWQAGCGACLPRPRAVLCCLIRSRRLSSSPSKAGAWEPAAAKAELQPRRPPPALPSPSWAAQVRAGAPTRSPNPVLYCHCPPRSHGAPTPLEGSSSWKRRPPCPSPSILWCLGASWPAFLGLRFSS